MLILMGQVEWMIIIFVIIYMVLIKKGSDPKSRGIKDENKNNEIKLFPDTCPHCKSPNTKNIRLCEWCGNQIV
jgi:hypothetical protein